MEKRQRMGESVGCQPSGDASDFPGCLTFLLALSKKNWNDEIKLKQKIQSQLSIMWIGYFEMMKVNVNN